MNLIVNTDGACRGNPGPSSVGFIIKTTDGVILHEEGKAIGIATNNIAEYTAVLKAFEYIDGKYNHKAPHVVSVVCDSQLIARQLSGDYKVKNPTLKTLYAQIKDIEEVLGKVSYKNVPRAQNFIADKLANIALDKKT